MSLFVIDTTTDRDIMVNDVLIQQTLAIKQPDTRRDEEGGEKFSFHTPQVTGTNEDK